MKALLGLVLFLAMLAAAASADVPLGNNVGPQQPAGTAANLGRQAFVTARRKALQLQRETSQPMRVFPLGESHICVMMMSAQVAGQHQLNLLGPDRSARHALCSSSPGTPSGDRAAVAAAVADPGTDRRGRDVTAARIHAQALDAHISAVAATAGVEDKVSQRYTFALSGFALKNPTLAEVQALRANPQVVSVTPSTLMHKQTFSSPWFLGLTSRRGENPNVMQALQQPQGLWDKLGGVVGPNGAGEGQIIGVIDSGLWLEDHPSFAEQDYWPSANSLKGQFYKPLEEWRGTCQADADGTAYPCNHKVIGCRFFADHSSELLEPDYDILGCKDPEGHGTHTAGIAAGNYGVATPLSPPGEVISGMAPRARLSVYKVLWGREGLNSAADTIAGVEAALSDGVDVMSLSLGEDVEWDTLSTPFQMAVMNAARAGVVVSLAGMNQGPGLSTTTNNAPGAISVAASTLPRSISTTLGLGDGTKLEGAGLLFTPVGPLPLVYSGNATAPGMPVAEAQLCAPDSLDPSVVDGKAVACDRGIYDRVAKAAEVQRAGGRAMIPMDTPDSAQGIVVEKYVVPTIHLPLQARATVIDYAVTAPLPTASIAGSTVSYDTVAPAMASFSGRGPVPVANGAVMKPDVTAPGVDILAAFTGTPPSDGYAYLGGTSMATPHVSGVAALLKDKHPHWTPMMIKSALMTTAYTANTAGQPFGNALDFGSGHINPEAAINPGLVVTSNFNDWMTLVCAAEPRPNDPMCMELCPSAQTVVQQADEVKAEPLAAAVDGDSLHSLHHARSLHSQTANPKYQGRPGGGDDYQHRAGSGYHPDYYSNDQDDQYDVDKVAASTCPADRVSFDLNGPWVSGNVGGTLVVQRTLTAVCPGDDHVHFTAVTSASRGSHLSISVWPQSITLSDGESTTVTITVKATELTPLNVYQFGQVVWYSNMGHVVRMPVSVNFKAVLAPSIIAPVNRLASFDYNYGIRTPGPSSVHVLSTPLQPAEVVDVPVAQTAVYAVNHGYYELTVAADIDFFAAGLFFGDQPGLLDIWLLDSNSNEIAGPSRLDHNLAAFLEVQRLAAGTYQVYMEETVYRGAIDVHPPSQPFNASLHIWQLNYQDAPGANDLMTVSPNPVPVDALGMGHLSVSFNGLTLPIPKEPPTRYLGYLGYAKSGLGEDSVTDTTRVSFFFPFSWST